MMIEHSPLPWRALPDGPVGAREIYDANDRCVGWVHEPLNSAAFIVKAVNNHERLVDALRALQKVARLTYRDEMSASSLLNPGMAAQALLKELDNA